MATSTIKQPTQDFSPLRVFLSYAHRDRGISNRLMEHLSPLRRQGFIDCWWDREMLAGSVIDGEIARELQSANVILLLISASYINSDYCYCLEMKRAIERHEAELVKVIPILLKPCDWHSAPFGKLLALPDGGKAVTSWRNRDSAFESVATGLRRAIAPLTAIKPAPKQIITRAADFPKGPNLIVGLQYLNQERGHFDFTLQDSGSCEFSSIDVMMSIPESAENDVDIFQSVGGGKLGPLGPGMRVGFPASPKIIDYLMRKCLALDSGFRSGFLSQIQLTVGAVISGSDEEHSRIFRFQFERLDDDRWECKLILDKVVPSRIRLIIKPKDGVSPAFGGEFFLERKYE